MFKNGQSNSFHPVLVDHSPRCIDREARLEPIDEFEQAWRRNMEKYMII